MSKFVEMLDAPSDPNLDVLATHTAIRCLQNEAEKQAEHGTVVISAQAQSDDGGDAQNGEAARMPCRRFMGIVFALCLVIFIFALDQLIVATTLPAIADNFNALDKMSWLVNSFSVPLFAFNLAYSQWLQFVPAKHLAIFAVLLFESGQVLAGAAPNLATLLAGRSISGLGGAGLYSVSVMILTEICPSEQRTKLLGVIGVSFALASVVGPVLGGTLAQELNWRWIFFINLPFGAVALAMIMLLIKQGPPYGHEATYSGYNLAMLDRLLYCDWVAVLLCLAWGACLVVSLEAGGHALPWNAPAEITALVLVAVLPIFFILWERKMGRQAMLRTSVFKKRNIVAVTTLSTFAYACFTSVLFFLSETFRAVYNIPGRVSGALFIPFVIGNIAALTWSAFFVSATRLAWPLLVAGPLFLTAGSSALTSLSTTSSMAFPIGISTLNGVGIGLISQTVIVVAQEEFKSNPEVLACVSGIVIFFGNLGRLIGMAIISTIFASRIVSNLRVHAPTLDNATMSAVEHRAEAIWHEIPQALRPQVLHAYTLTLDQVFIASACFGALALPASFLMKWQRINAS